MSSQRQDDPQFDERMQRARERLAQPYCDDCGGTDPDCPLGTHWEGCEEVHPECKKTGPVAWGMPSAGGGFVVDCITPDEHARMEGGYTIPLYTTPPRREWVGLTPDQVFAIADQHPVDGFDPEIMAFVRAIEAKLREKNA